MKNHMNVRNPVNESALQEANLIHREIGVFLAHETPTFSIGEFMSMWDRGDLSIGFCRGTFEVTLSRGREMVDSFHISMEQHERLDSAICKIKKLLNS